MHVQCRSMEKLSLPVVHSYSRKYSNVYRRKLFSIRCVYRTKLSEISFTHSKMIVQTVVIVLVKFETNTKIHIEVTRNLSETYAQ